MLPTVKNLENQLIYLFSCHAVERIQMMSLPGGHTFLEYSILFQWGEIIWYKGYMQDIGHS